MRPLVRDGGVRKRAYPTNRATAKMSPAERITRGVAVDEETGCWVWQRALVPGTGYGTISIGGKVLRTHRVSYEAFVGPIPEGLQIDHLCRNRACCNPQHLEPVTAKVNVNRAPSSRSHITHCPRGHAYDETNTYVTPQNQRHCRTCSRARLAIWKSMTPEERAARKAAGLPVVDLDAYFAEESAA